MLLSICGQRDAQPPLAHAMLPHYGSIACICLENGQEMMGRSTDSGSRSSLLHPKSMSTCSADTLRCAQLPITCVISDEHIENVRTGEVCSINNMICWPQRTVHRVRSNDYSAISTTHTCWSRKECDFELLLANAKGVLEKKRQGGGASMSRSLLESKTKTVKCRIMYHFIQGPIACKESTVSVREREGGACPALQGESVCKGNALE
eukprot:6177425-Pleurochrysis_carterae.AAC.2